MFACCCRKKKNRTTMGRHQPLCNKDSGTVNIHVKRLAGPPLLRNPSKDSDSSSAYGAHSPGIYSVDGHSGQLNSPERNVLANPLLRNKTVYRASPVPDRPGTYIQSAGSLRSTQHLRESVRNSALESAICRFGRRFDEDEQTQPTISIQRDSPKSRDSSTLDGGGFTLSSSFEGGLDKIESVVQDSKMSSYDNLSITQEELDRKQSLYDNVDDATQQPQMSPEIVQHLENSCSQRLLECPSPANKRRSSKTLPLRFTMFSGGQHSRGYDDTVEDDDDSDYVNIPPLSRDSQRQKQGFRPKVNTPRGNTSKPGRKENDTTQFKLNIPQEEGEGKKKRYRRGSQTLKLFCSRKPPILSKIEKQVMAYVPIIGEPTPEPIAKNPLNDFDFPPPPAESPPKVPVGVPGPYSPVTCYNPMYSPNTAGTPGCGLDSGNPYNKPNAYFSF